MDNYYLSPIGQWLPGNAASSIPTNPSVVPGGSGLHIPLSSPSQPRTFAPPQPMPNASMPDALGGRANAVPDIFSVPQTDLPDTAFPFLPAPMADRPAASAPDAPSLAAVDVFSPAMSGVPCGMPPLSFDFSPTPMSGVPGVVSPGPFDVFPTPNDTPETLASPIYTPGFLRTQIGKMMRVEFLIGDQTNSRTGRLMQVGASYILLESTETRSAIMCDLYSIRFVTILQESGKALL